MVNTWIFQANPSVFDIDGYLSACAGDFRFLVTRYKKEIAVGDTVYVWRSIGKQGDSESAGVIASAVVVDEPVDTVADAESLPFWRDPNGANELATRVTLRLLKFANKKQILQREWLKEDSILKDLSILKFASGTNFPVSQVQAERLGRLWSNTGRNWTEPESVAALCLYGELWNKSISKTAGSPVETLAQKISRAPTGVYNKLMNFRALDPRVPEKGFSGGSKIDAIVWNRYFNPGSGDLDQAALSRDTARLWGNAPAQDILAEQDQTAEEVSRLSDKPLDTLLATYKKAPRVPTKRSRASVSTFNRSPLVAAITLKRANWKCEVDNCTSPVLYGQDGKPLVEVHHLHRLADGGPDDITNTVCVCPNHHRALHHGKLAEQLRSRLVRLRDSGIET